MDFPSFAAGEAATLADRLLARHTARSREQLQALREALDAACSSLERPIDANEEIREVAARLGAAAADEILAARADAESALDAVRIELGAQVRDAAALRAGLDAARGRAESAERELGAALETRARLQESLRAAEALAQDATDGRSAAELEAAEARATVERLLAEIDAVRAAAAAHRAETERLAEQLSQARQVGVERDALQAQLQAADARVAEVEARLVDADRAERARDALAAELDAATARLRDADAAAAETERLQDERDVLARELASSTRRAEALEAEHDRALEHARAQHQAEVAALQARIADLAAVPAPPPCMDPAEPEALRGEVDRMTALFDASSRAATEMAGATSATGLLTELVKRLSLQFSRVALFRVKGTRLEGAHQVGFDDSIDVARLSIPADADSILARALSAGTLESLSGDDVAARSGMPVGGSPTSAVALPIELHGTALAVVYADDADMPEAARGRAIHESSVAFARLLVGQVVVLLVRHTHELRTLAELSQYASTLLQEARAMYEADVESGKGPDLLRSRLKANIDCASQLYAYRAAMEGTAAAALLDEQIAAEVEGATPFAQDLAAVVAGMTASEIQLTAETS